MYEITSGIDSSVGEKIVIYGVEGVGKTTLAAYLPDPIFIDMEGGTSKYANIKRLPVPKDWEDLKNMVTWFSMEKPGKTLVIDTFDWAEAMEIKFLCEQRNWKTLESAGYGNGYAASADEIRKFLDQLTEELIRKGINVCLLCHAQIRKFEQPDEQGAYDRYELKLGKKTSSQTSPVVREWADCLLFCNYKTYVETYDDGKKAKATGGQERIIYTTHNAVWEAKNRYGLPDEMPMTAESINRIFGKPEAKPSRKPAAKKATSSTQKKAAPAPKAEPISKDEILPNTDRPSTQNPIVYWKKVPESVKQLCKEHGIFTEDVQRMMYDNKITKELNFNLDNVPAKFWESFVKEYDTRWSPLIEQAKEKNLPY